MHFFQIEACVRHRPFDLEIVLMGSRDLEVMLPEN